MIILQVNALLLYLSQSTYVMFVADDFVLSHLQHLLIHNGRKLPRACSGLLVMILSIVMETSH